MAIFDIDVVISPMNIKLGEMMSIFQLVDEVGDKRKGVGIVGGVFIEVPVVLAEVELAIFLLNKEEERCLGGVGRVDFSSSQVFFKEVFSGLLFIGGKQVDLACLRCEGLTEVDLMIIGLGRGNMISCFFEEDLAKVSIL